MPHLIVDHERTWISTEDLRRELSEGALPETVAIEHAPWTGREARPASEIDDLADALQAPAAQLARRLSRLRFPWTGALWAAAVAGTVSVGTPRIADLLDSGPTLLHRYTDLTSVEVLTFALLMVPIWLAGRLRVMGPTVMLGVLGGLSMMAGGTLLSQSGALLSAGALCAGSGAAMGAVERIRPMLPPMRQDWGRWGWWALLAGLMGQAVTARLELSLLLLGLSALSALAGRLLPSRPWQIVVGALALPLSLLLTSQAIEHPALLMLDRHTGGTGAAGVTLDLPGFLYPPHLNRLAPDTHQWSTTERYTPRPQRLSLTVTVSPARPEPLLPDGLHQLEQGVWHRYHTDGDFQVAAKCESSGGDWREALCISLLEEATFATPFSVTVTEALAAGGSQGAQIDHMVALFAADQHAAAWEHLLTFYPLTWTTIGLDADIWTYLEQHGECAAMESLGRVPEDAHRRQALIETCLAEVSAR